MDTHPVSACVRHDFFGVKALPALRFLRADNHEVVIPYELRTDGLVLGEVGSAGQPGMMGMTPSTHSWVEAELARVVQYMRDQNWLPGA